MVTGAYVSRLELSINHQASMGQSLAGSMERVTFFVENMKRQACSHHPDPEEKPPFDDQEDDGTAPVARFDERGWCRRTAAHTAKNSASEVFGGTGATAG
jgi:hypothetical protein